MARIDIKGSYPHVSPKDGIKKLNKCTRIDACRAIHLKPIKGVTGKTDKNKRTTLQQNKNDSAPDIDQRKKKRGKKISAQISFTGGYISQSSGSGKNIMSGMEKEPGINLK